MFFMKLEKGLDLCHKTEGALLIDVREPDEFQNGHIPGAVNVPLSQISCLSEAKDRPLFLYCLRGSRSLMAKRTLKKLGFTRVKSIGGIGGYKGRIEQGQA